MNASISKNYLGGYRWLVLALAVMFFWVGSAQAAPKCQTLYAGQTIYAGTVCMDNTASSLTVSYRTENGWALDEMHLYIGKSLFEMPQTRTGNPQVGLFPLTANATGATEYTFDLPLGDYGVVGDTLVVAAHAVVMRTSSDGSMRKETAWGSGQRIVAKGNWATYFTYIIQAPPVVSACKSTETAFAYGDMTLNELGTGINRWGWQITVDAMHGYSGSTPLYAGAGRNDISKATLVGQFQYEYANGWLNITYQAYPGYSLKETHVFAGNSYVATGAPGQFGNLHGDLNLGTMLDRYVIQVPDIDADGIFVVGHATICFH